MFQHTSVERHGELVSRSTGPWTPSVHSLLRHLKEKNFLGAPRLAGSGYDAKGRETLTYIDGETMYPGAVTVEAAAAVGHLAATSSTEWSSLPSIRLQPMPMKPA